MTPVRRAMILGAGLGSRLRPLTLGRPKPCVPFMGEPLLYRGLRQMGRAGIEEVVVNTCYLPDVLEALVRTSPPGLPRVLLSREEEMLGTGGGIRKAFEDFGSGEEILVVNGDVVMNLDVAQLLHRHKSAGAEITLVTVERPELGDALHKVHYGNSGGVQAVDGVSHSSAVAGPFRKGIYTGAAVLGRGVIERIPTPGYACLKEEGFWPALRSGLSVQAMEVDSYWSDIGTPERYLATHWEWFGQVDALAFELAERGFQSDGKGNWVHGTAVVEAGAVLHGNTLIGEGAVVRKGAELGPFCVLGPRTDVSPNALFHRVVVWGDESVGGVASDAVLWNGERLSAAS